MKHKDTAIKFKYARRIGLTATVFVLIVSCTSKFLKYEKEDDLKKNDEFSRAVKIEQVIEKSENISAVKTAPPVVISDVLPKNVNKVKKNKAIKTQKAPAEPTKAISRQPELEDTEGFLEGKRRPLVDPFRVGEVITYDVHYFKVIAGEMKLAVNPFVAVNGRKSYNFSIDIRSSSLFSKFYSVEDRVETLMDYEELIPRVFTMHVKESGQLREARSFFDFDKNKAFYWEKKVTKKSGEEEKKMEWDILPYSQNVFSALFYMRFFQWKDGKEYAFRVADDKENLIFKGKTLRREKLRTQVGEFNSIVIKPEITLQGQFKPIGDIFIWLSDDERKIILRIESNIKIGTLVAEVTKIE